jgi:Brp/Blh family beta-carotene 15,15'-monooxygenase
MAAAGRRWLDQALRAQSATACVVTAGFCAAAACDVRFGVSLQLAVLLGGIVVIGFPHGAFDHLVARPRLSRRLGDLWWLPFGIGYFGLAGAVWLAWMMAPSVTLAGFIAASIVHFGLGDAEEGHAPASVPRLVTVVTMGALPVLLPAALHPADAAPVLAALGDVSVPAMMRVLAGCFWLVPVWVAAFAWLCAARGRHQPGLLERVLSAAGFVVLPPLLAFALYFTFGHSIRHLLRLGAWHDDRNFPAALRWTMRTLVPASLVCALGIAGLFCLPWRASSDLLVPVFRVIAALTLPHMIVTSWLDAEKEGVLS